jgi:2-desacetyl-2-hydroxyethyl bacteriochlorophyllide A dehydrogenase
MRRALWTTDGLEVTDVEPGPLREGWARLQVAACGICGSDLHWWHGTMRRPLGTAPGHELAGTVLDGPAGLDDVLYAVSPNVSCGRCPFCQVGQTHLCDRALGRGLGMGADGGLSEVLDVPVANLAPVTTAAPAVAALTEPLAVALRGVSLGDVGADSRVLVLGAGTIGLGAALLARDRAGEVAITARHPHQAAAAEAMGVTVLGEDEGVSWAKSVGSDVVIESVGGSAPTLDEAVKACRKGGTIVLLGSFTEPRPVDLSKLMMKELRLQGSFCYGSTKRGPEYAAAAQLTGRFEPELGTMTTHQFGLEDVVDAFETAADKSSGAIKVTILPN